MSSGERRSFVVSGADLLGGLKMRLIAMAGSYDVILRDPEAPEHDWLYVGARVRWFTRNQDLVSFKDGTVVTPPYRVSDEWYVVADDGHRTPPSGWQLRVSSLSPIETTLVRFEGSRQQVERGLTNPIQCDIPPYEIVEVDDE